MDGLSYSPVFFCFKDSNFSIINCTFPLRIYVPTNPMLLVLPYGTNRQWNTGKCWSGIQMALQMKISTMGIFEILNRIE